MSPGRASRPIRRWYPKAEGVLRRSLRLHPDENVDGALGIGALDLARHDFAAALRQGRRAASLDPYDADAYGVIGDALLELGRYDRAFESFQTMVDKRPDLASYARVAYARELLGDVSGAERAMQHGVRCGRDAFGLRVDGVPARRARVRLRRRRLGPRAGTRAAWTSIPRTSRTWRGSRRWRGRAATTSSRSPGSRRSSRALPVGRVRRWRSRDLYRATGRPALADQQEAVVAAMHDLATANGVNVDLELALFDADHGDPAGALAAARAEWARRQSIHVADAYAWALYANGRYRRASAFAERALALGTRNALFLFHAGMIRLELGDRDAARDVPLARPLDDQPELLDPARGRCGQDARRGWGRRRRAGDEAPARRRCCSAVWSSRSCPAPAHARSRTRSGTSPINRYAAIELIPGEVRIEYVVDMAEIPTVQVRPAIDTDADGTITDPERAGWAARTGLELLANLTLTVDGRAVPLDVVSSSMRFRPGQGGLDILRLEATFAGPVASSGALAFADANFADRIGWSEVTAAGTDGTAVARSSVPARSVSNALLSYPQDLLASPLDVHEAALSFRPGTGAPAAAATGGVEANALRPDVTGGAFAGLVGRTGPFMLVALLLAFGFGALHALGPGHGKTLMAAYLVGAGGRARHAIAVGGSVAVMHTASVLALGFVVLTVTEVFAPERVYPWLGLVSGVIAFALGASLLVARLGSWGGRRGGPDHHHANARRSTAGHDARTPLTPLRPRCSRGGASRRSPSPAACSRRRPRWSCCSRPSRFDRIAYGLALIGAFSSGSRPRSWSWGSSRCAPATSSPGGCPAGPPAWCPSCRPRRSRCWGSC